MYESETSNDIAKLLTIGPTIAKLFSENDVNACFNFEKEEFASWKRKMLVLNKCFGSVLYDVIVALTIRSNENHKISWLL